MSDGNLSRHGLLIGGGALAGALPAGGTAAAAKPKQSFVYPPGVRVEHVRFPAGGAEGGMVECAADVYTSDSFGDPAPRPGIILAWSGLTPKEANAGVAWYLARAGYVCMAIDYRTSGASTGAPRGQVYFENNVQDMRYALHHFASRPDVDATAIGLHGVSPSGAVAMRVAARDRRVKCVSALYPSTVHARPPAHPHQTGTRKAGQFA